MNSGPCQRKVLITNPNGLHMRPSAAFVEMASRYQCSVSVSHNGQTVNGKSLWDMLMLVAVQGSELTLEVDGPDAPAAMEALVGVLTADSDHPENGTPCPTC